MCTYWHTGQSMVCPGWWECCESGECCLDWSEETAEWPVATSPALYQHIEHETAQGSNTLTHFTSKNHMIIRPVITEYGILEYPVMREDPQLWVQSFHSFHDHVCVRLVHQYPVCGLGWRAGYEAAYRHRGIQESTQGASHAMATFVSRQTMNPSFCQNIKQPTEKRLVIVLKSIILHRRYFTFAF